MISGREAERKVAVSLNILYEVSKAKSFVKDTIRQLGIHRFTDENLESLAKALVVNPENIAPFALVGVRRATWGEIHGSFLRGVVARTLYKWYGSSMIPYRPWHEKFGFKKQISFTGPGSIEIFKQEKSTTPLYVYKDQVLTHPREGFPPDHTLEFVQYRTSDVPTTLDFIRDRPEMVQVTSLIEHPLFFVFIHLRSTSNYRFILEGV